MSGPENRPPLGGTNDLSQRAQDREIAAATAGCTFSQDLDVRANTLAHVLNSARLMDENDPRRGVLAVYGQRLLEIVAPETQQLAEGNQ
jgi:hypothetical protein